MTVACIIQARLGSSRLPGKVLLPLPTGRTVIEEVVFRARQIKGIDEVVVATPDDEGDEIQDAVFRSDKLGAGEELPKVFVFQGPHHDVLKRYALAAEAFAADVIMRITADCPLIDPWTAWYVLDRLRLKGLAYACNNRPRNVPHGLDVEVFTRGILRHVEETATDAYDREHVCPMMRRLVTVDDANVKIGPLAVERIVGHPIVDASHIRWTLDTPEDYDVICEEFKRRETHAPH